MYAGLAIRLREAVNNDEMFKVSKSGDNSWNIICSCMDWLYHSGSQLDKDYDKLLKNEKNTFEYIVPYISYIDLFLEGYLQLRRTFLNLNYKDNIYEKSNNYFKNCIYNPSTQKQQMSELHKNNDYKTFKHIRAMLGAHPNNLVIGDERYYASWSYVRGDNIKLGLWARDSYSSVEISLNDLKLFLADIAIQINVLINEIPKIIECHIRNYRAQTIEWENDYRTNIELLREEINKRVYAPRVEEYLAQYKKILKVISTDKDIVGYQNHIKKLIDKLKIEVQNVEIISDFDYAIDVEAFKEQYNIKDSYSISKVYYADEVIYNIIRDEIQEIIGDKYKMPNYLSDDVLVKVWSILHDMMIPTSYL